MSSTSTSLIRLCTSHPVYYNNSNSLRKSKTGEKILYNEFNYS